VRHARTAWTGRRYCGLTDLPLSVTGRREAAALADRIRPLAPSAVVLTSPLRRALQTAQAIALGRPLHVDRRLREVDFGEAEGLSFAQIAGRWPDLAATLASGTVPLAWPAGERWSDVGARVRAVREDLRDLKSDVIVVTHAFIAVALLEGSGVAGLSPAGVGIVELDLQAART